MEKENKKSIGEKLGIFTGFIKNAKFLVLTTMTLVAFGAAIISGDGKYIVLSFYENITGQKYQNFSPVQDFSNATYQILKDKVSRDINIKLESADITIFEESDTSHRYRVESEDEVYFYSVNKRQDGTWRINKE